MRIGIGKDIHKTIAGKELFLGGVNIPSNFGLEAHSDGDVIIHALVDAILGALALGDIGVHYPNTDDKFKDYDSKLFLKDMKNILDLHGYFVENIDICVVCEAPKLKDYVLSMRKCIAECLAISIEKVSIKPGTNEGIGEIGAGKAIEATAVVLLNETNK